MLGSGSGLFLAISFLVERFSWSLTKITKIVYPFPVQAEAMSHFWSHLLSWPVVRQVLGNETSFLYAEAA